MRKHLLALGAILAVPSVMAQTNGDIPKGK